MSGRCCGAALRRYGALTALVACTAGCNCQDLGALCTAATANPGSTSISGSAAGIWTGTDSATGLELTGYIDSSGQADFFRSDGVQFVGTAEVNGTSLDISLSGYTQFEAEFPDGSTSGIGTFDGTFSAASSISGSESFTTSGDTTTTSTWSLTFDPLYNTASALSTISGTYRDELAAVSDGVDPLSGSSLTISSAGVMYGQGSSDGCVLNGTVTDTNTSNDLYEVSYSYGNCSGTYAMLNGVEFSGLAEMNPNQSPTQIVIAVTGGSSTGADYGVVSDLSAD